MIAEGLITDLLSNILLLIATGLNFLLLPIDRFISTYLPSVDSALTTVVYFFNQVTSVCKFVISYSGFTDITLSLIVVGIITPTLISVVLFPIKLGIKWYRSLKL